MNGLSLKKGRLLLKKHQLVHQEAVTCVAHYLPQLGHQDVFVHCSTATTCILHEFIHFLEVISAIDLLTLPVSSMKVNIYASISINNRLREDTPLVGGSFSLWQEV